MSGLAAIVTANAAPAPLDSLACMLDSMRVRGPDGISSWAGEGAALGYLALHTTQEAVHEQQPLVDRLTGSVIVLDGRLDNRDDLIATLGDAVSRWAGDAAIIAAAYRRWGADAFTRLVGDFAIVIWDARQRCLVCARDVMGVRPLAYAQADEGVWLVASEVKAILETRLVGDAINDAHALEHLCGEELRAADTLFRDVQRLEPGHVMVLSIGHAATSRRFWDFDPGKSVRYRDPRDYALHARELFGRVIRAHVRCRNGVGVLLSGGLDSSIVTALAVAEGADVETFTMTYGSAACDETSYVDAVNDFCGVTGHRAAFEPPAADWFESRVKRDRDLPEPPNGKALADLRQAAAATGRRVMLSGVGGDEWFTGGSALYADWLREGAYRRVAAEWYADVRERGWYRANRYLSLFGLWPILPAAAQAGIKRLVRRSPVPDWIDAGVAQQYDLRSRIAPPVVRREGETFGQRSLRNMTGGFQVHTEEVDDRAASHAGVEPRNPFYDRRVIEFAYGLPPEQRWRRATSKVVLREMVAGLLPDVVRLRRDKAEFTQVYHSALPRFGNEGFPHLRARGWIDGAAVERLRQAAFRPSPDGTLAMFRAVKGLWNMRSVELWLASETRRRDAGQHELTHGAFASTAG